MLVDLAGACTATPSAEAADSATVHNKRGQCANPRDEDSISCKACIRKYLCEHALGWASKSEKHRWAALAPATAAGDAPCVQPPGASRGTAAIVPPNTRPL